MAASRRPRWSAWLAVVLLGATASTACVVLPMRVTTRVETPDRAKHDLPKQPIVPGTTTRQDVEQWYREFAVDSGVPSLFWGRFRKSTWAVVWAFIDPFDGPYDMTTGGAGRRWGVHNLLVTFDSSGVVKSSAVVPEKELQTRLARAAIEAAAPPLDLSQPLLVEEIVPDSSDKIRGIEVELNDSGLTVSKYPPWTSRDQPAPLARAAAIPVEQIEAVQVGDPGAVDAGLLRVELRFTSKTEVGDRVRFWAHPRWAAVVTRWWDEVRRR